MKLSITVLIVSSIILLHSVSAELSPLGRKCKEGEKGLKPGVKFYAVGEEIYASYYNGCGFYGMYETYGEAARYREFNDDSLNCPFNAKPTGKCNKFVNRKNLKATQCPKGSYCLGLLGADNNSKCCSNVHKAEFEEARAGKCEKNEVAQKFPGSKKVLLGQKCSNTFCQKGARCVQKKFEAYCCIPSKKA